MKLTKVRIVPTSSNFSMGTKIYLDDQEIKRVRSYSIKGEATKVKTLTLEIVVGEVVWENSEADEAVDVTSHDTPGEFRQFFKQPTE